MGVLLVEQHLTLEVRVLDVIAVDDPEEADPRASHYVGDDGPEGAAADQGDAARKEALLALLADAGEDNLPGVPIHE